MGQFFFCLGTLVMIRPLDNNGVVTLAAGGLWRGPCSVKVRLFNDLLKNTLHIFRKLAYSTTESNLHKAFVATKETLCPVYNNLKTTKFDVSSFAFPICTIACTVTTIVSSLAQEEK